MERCAHCNQVAKLNGQWVCRDCAAIERDEYARSLSSLNNENFHEAMQQYDESQCS
jgi:hypothetical protein